MPHRLNGLEQALVQHLKGLGRNEHGLPNGASVEELAAIGVDVERPTRSQQSRLHRAVRSLAREQIVDVWKTKGTETGEAWVYKVAIRVPAVEDDTEEQRRIRLQHLEDALTAIAASWPLV